MNSHSIYSIGQLTGFVASVILIAAFILTLWPGRKRLATAAVLYVVGIMSGLSFTVYFYIDRAQMLYGLSSMSVSGSPVAIAVVEAIRPIAVVGYAFAASALLWPSIPQQKALRGGKIVHLGIGLPLAMLASLTPLSSATFAFGVGWLVYSLLWFRIREGYPNFSSSQNIEPK